MNKFIHGPNVSGQSIVDRALAAKHTVAGQSLAKVICKATTEEIMGPKKKHLDYLLQCTNEPNISIPQMANLLIERTQNTSWVVVFKALVTVHNLMNYGNERFTQFLASNNCSFHLSSFTDKSGTQGYEMSTFIRRYSKYLNEKAFSYRQMAFDFCKVKRGKEDGLLRTMSTEKLLRTLPVLQGQLDTLIEFDASHNELTNGVINAAFMLLFKDLIRLFACYNDGIINLLEKYFDMNKKHCREALEIYKKFLARMDRVCEFLKVAEGVGIDRGDIPDLAKAPSSLMEALEQHLNSLESNKKSGVVVNAKPAAGVSAAISNYAAASQVGTAPGAGMGVTSISDEERQRILEEEQRQLDQMKQQRLKQMAGCGSPAGSSTSSNASTSGRSSTTATLPATSTAAMVALNQPNDPFSPIVSNSTGTSKSSHINDLLSLNEPSSNPPFHQHQQQPSLFTGSAFPTANVFPPSSSFGLSLTPSSGVSSSVGFGGTTNGSGGFSNPFGAPQRDSTPWGGSNPEPAVDDFASVFGNSLAPHSEALKVESFGELLKPTMTTNLGAPAPQPLALNGKLTPVPQSLTKPTDSFKLIQSDLDSSLASLAGNLNISPIGQIKKTEHQWSGNAGEKKLTGGVNATAWGQPGFGGPTNWNQVGQAYPQPMVIGLQQNNPSVLPVQSMWQQRPISQGGVMWGSTPQLQMSFQVSQPPAKASDPSDNPFGLL